MPRELHLGSMLLGIVVVDRYILSSHVARVYIRPPRRVLRATKSVAACLHQSRFPRIKFEQ